MKFIIIGSKGFIGQKCFDYFSKVGEVWGCDILEDNFEKNYIKISALSPDFNQIFKNTKYDICINCSGAANVPMSMENPMLDFQLNTINVFQLLNSIRLFNSTCKFINLSSAAVYGNPKELPITELSRLNPISPYGYHKEMAEIICKEFYEFWNIGTVSIRIFSAYGPGLKKQIMWDLAQKLKRDDCISLFGTGYETRDFIYIDDLIEIIHKVITNGKFQGNVINAANGMQIKITTIAQMVRDSLSSQKNINFTGSNREGDPLYWEADITKAKKLGYIQKTSIEEGIKKYAKWLKENELV